MKLVAATIAVLSFFGCVTANPAYQAQWKEKQSAYLAEIVSVRCPATGGSTECGILADSMAQDWIAFSRDVCSPQKLDAANCRQRFGETYLARVKLRYPRADWVAAQLWCDANPRECNLNTSQGIARYELELLGSHNRAVAASAKLDHDTIQLQSDQDIAARRKTASDAYSHAFGNSGTNCTSTTAYDGTVYTHCH